MLNPLIQNKLTDINRLMKQYHIKRAYLFGSTVKDTFNDTSDVDVLVDVDETIEPATLGGYLWDLQFELEKLLGRKVDLLTSRSLRNPYFINEVNATKQLIYE
jgi:predicted nucleotidyltransferase